MLNILLKNIKECGYSPRVNLPENNIEVFISQSMKGSKLVIPIKGPAIRLCIELILKKDYH
jgi:hypothetical protein